MNSKVVFCFSLYSLSGVLGEDVTFELGNLGSITGRTARTSVYPTAPYSGRDYYKFRNIPYAHPVVGEDRFKQSQLWNNTALSSNRNYDATRDGPLCIQGTFGPEDIDNFKSIKTNTLVAQLLCEESPFPIPCDSLEEIAGSIISILELLLEIGPGTLSNKTVGQALEDWLDISLGMSEDCLQLTVSTPWRPDGSENKTLPVMFFIHGGAFYGGTHIRMSSERLGSWDDVIVVGINYRIGPLGFMCLDTEEAAGNMGMLDMVVALEWVHQYIGYFGGNASRITIFGESAGSAAINHLLLSTETNDLFQQGIGQSGSALASWAFDTNAEFNAKEIARKVNCTQETHDDIVLCLRDVPAINISKAFTDYNAEMRKNGGLGFGGSIPCAQKKGQRKFYDAAKGETPESLLFAGNYRHVPILFGANSHEGSYVYSTIYNAYLEPNNLTEDEDFLKNRFVPQILKTVGVSNSYAIENLIKAAYFEEWQLGNLTNMRPGAIDLFSVFFLKASSYKTVEENSKYKNSYWYSFDYQSVQKSIFHTLFIDPAKKGGLVEPGVCHADELIYMFDVELPLVLCNLGDLLPELTPCILSQECFEGSEFRRKWHHCITGHLTEEELTVSATISKMWTSFAVSGDPGFNLTPWTSSSPSYLSINVNNIVKEDYTQDYHVALEQSLNKTETTTEQPTTTTTTTIEPTSTTTTTIEPTSTTTTSTAGNHVASGIYFIIGLLNTFLYIK